MNLSLQWPRWFQWLDQLLQNCAWWHSYHYHSGTILCVKKSIAITTQATQISFPDNIGGRMVAAKLKTTSKPMLLISTYWPSGTKRASLEIRKCMEEALKGLLNSCHCIPILLGDMNATLFPQDRTRGYPTKRISSSATSSLTPVFVPLTGT